MDPLRLLKHYASFYGPEAGPWNLSPECLFVDYKLRAFAKNLLETHFPPSTPVAVCNVGIGQGDWDIFLSYAIASRGDLTSVDISSDTCRTLHARLSVEENPNSIRIVNEDINQTTLPAAAFDLVTLIGSTLEESGGGDRTLESCLRLLKPDGVLMYADFVKYRPLTFLHEFAETHCLRLVACDDCSDHSLPFYAAALVRP